MYVQPDTNELTGGSKGLRNPSAVTSEPDVQGGWEAKLRLKFSHRADDGKTLLTQRWQRGPLTVQRPFYPEGGLCHVYLLHPPGGIVGGDSLRVHLHAEARAEALLTTPAAGKFYRSAGKQASQQVRIRLDADAVLEWLPQETIIYQGAHLASSVSVELADGAHFFGWEILALGRPASGESFSSGETHLQWQFRRQGSVLYVEKMRLDARAFAARWGLHRRSVCATLFAYPASTAHLAKVRELIGETPGLGVTLIDELLMCRAVEDKVEPVRRFFERVRAVLRQDLVRRDDFAPRIWAT